MPLDSPRSPEEALNQAKETLKNNVRCVGSSPVARVGSSSGAARTAILFPSIDSGGPFVHELSDWSQPMKETERPAIRIGAWRVDAAREQISKDGSTVKLERRSMQLLLCLADHPGQILSVEELLDRVWAGVVVTPDSVYQAVASLRRILGDDANEPTYIANIPRRGYSLVAPVAPWVDQPETAAESTPLPLAAVKVRARSRWTAIGTFLALTMAVGFSGTGNAPASEARRGKSAVSARCSGWSARAVADSREIHRGPPIR